MLASLAPHLNHTLLSENNSQVNPKFQTGDLLKGPLVFQVWAAGRGWESQHSFPFLHHLNGVPNKMSWNVRAVRDFQTPPHLNPSSQRWEHQRAENWSDMQNPSLLVKGWPGPTPGFPGSDTENILCSAEESFPTKWNVGQTLIQRAKKSATLWIKWGLEDPGALPTSLISPSLLRALQPLWGPPRVSWDRTGGRLLVYPAAPHTVKCRTDGEWGRVVNIRTQVRAFLKI